VASSRADDRSTALEAVSDALSDLVTKDRELLSLQAHELALVHRFGVYLERRLRRELQRYGLTVDLDYDRHGDAEKWLPARQDRDQGDKRRFRPDLIVHRQGDDRHNILERYSKVVDNRMIAVGVSPR
jgi:hypothetical protein